MMKTEKRPRFFISRPLSDESILLHSFSRQHYLWHDESLIAITPLPFSLDDIDSHWLFFYSKNGVKNWALVCDAHITSKFKIACLADGTSRVFRDIYNRQPDFSGTGSALRTAESFNKIATGQKVCFVRGKQSVKSVQELVEPSIEVSEIVVYDNTVKQTDLLGYFDIAIITSPMNYEGFIKNGGITNKIIAIGPTTASAIRDHISNNPDSLYIATEPSEKSIEQKLRDIIGEEKS